VRAAVVVLAALTVAGCGPRPAAAGPQSCAPSTEAPDPAASAAALVGEYRLRLVATSGPRRDSSADGRLVLEAPAGTAADSGTQRPALFGTGDVRLEDVGAPAADLTSRDPMRPGVVVFELPPRAGTADSPRVMLRFGAEANRRDVVRLEGASTVLRVREIREDGFVGDWTGNAPLPVAEGYFCAWKEPAVE